MRNIFVLADAIKSKIPSSEAWERLRDGIDKLTASYAYKAPEQWGPWFENMSELLSRSLGTPNEPWKKRIADLFADKAGISHLI